LFNALAAMTRGNMVVRCVLLEIFGSEWNDVCLLVIV